jgi:hypothetical protein
MPVAISTSGGAHGVCLAAITSVCETIFDLIWLSTYLHQDRCHRDLNEWLLEPCAATLMSRWADGLEGVVTQKSVVQALAHISRTSTVSGETPGSGGSG